MLTYMLDTDIVIYTMKMKPEAVREAFNAHYGQLAISSITLMGYLHPKLIPLFKRDDCPVLDIPFQSLQ